MSDENTRIRLNWETARRWSYAIEYLILPHVEDDSARQGLNDLMKEMRREE